MMCCSQRACTPADNQHAAAEAIRRRDCSNASAVPRSTYLHPLADQQRPTSSEFSPDSSNSPSSRPDNSRLRVNLPACIAVGAMAATVYLIARTRKASVRLAALQSARDKAVGQSIGWKYAYLASQQHPSLSGFQSLRQEPDERRSYHLDEILPRNPAGGFIHRRTAQTAKKEAQEELDTSHLLKDFADSARRFWDLATGSSVESHKITVEPHNKINTKYRNPHSKARSQRKRSNDCPQTNSNRSSPSRASRHDPTPAQRWQCAFGSGALNGQADDSGWEDVARAKALEAENYSKKHSDPTPSAAPNLSESGQEASSRLQGPDAHLSRRRVDKLKKDPQRKIFVDDALHDELDDNFLRRHIDKTKGASPSSLEPQPSKTGRGQHTSMDNLFLEFQLEDAAIEGREAREKMQQRVEASNASPLTTELFSQEQDMPEARLADPTLYGNETDTITHELTDELLKDRATGDESVTSTVKEEGARASPSLWETALASAEEEVAEFRRKKEAEQRETQERFERAEFDTEFYNDIQPRMTVLEPEDLDEALVLHRHSRTHPDTDAESRSISWKKEAAREERKRQEEASRYTTALTAEEKLEAEERMSDDSAVSFSSPSPFSASDERLAIIEARLELTSAELRLVKAQFDRLERSLANQEAKLTFPYR